LQTPVEKKDRYPGPPTPTARRCAETAQRSSGQHAFQRKGGYAWKKGALSAENTVTPAFAEALEVLGIRCSIATGYVSIPSGRSSGSSNLDFIAEPVDGERSAALCAELGNRNFPLMQGDTSFEESIRRIFKDYMSRELSETQVYGPLSTQRRVQARRNPFHHRY